MAGFFPPISEINGLGMLSTNALKPDIPTSFEPVNAIPHQQEGFPKWFYPLHRQNLLQNLQLPGGSL
ncbi:hypothetical protein [Candidatus Nitrosotalea sp. TS]|uniref:hypothetical protein n=1 Tax=Candidatus Nitrosotalea sp. TS TaxID=2341020 RepID=UPI0021038269|nr:hypothetical protein [Candidatus Nitrosotalea sp. TS]